MMTRTLSLVDAVDGGTPMSSRKLLAMAVAVGVVLVQLSVSGQQHLIVRGRQRARDICKRSRDLLSMTIFLLMAYYLGTCLSR